MRYRYRHPGLYLATLIVLLIVHFALCYPAAVSRGYPPMDPFWEYIAIYLAFLGIFFPPAFDDFSHAPPIRLGLLIPFAVLASMILAVAFVNLADARPHYGHLAGYFSVWESRWPEILGKTFSNSMVAIPFVICFESVSQGFWNRFRKLPT